MKHLSTAFALGPLLLLAMSCTTTSSPIEPLPAEFRAEHELEDFYQKRILVGELPVLGSARVSDEALREAAWILEHVLAGREDLASALARDGVHVAVMAYDEYTSDVPEHRELEPRVFWDRRARGLGGDPVSCGEENLLGFPNDPYEAENLLIHEFSHIVQGRGMKILDPGFEERLLAVYAEAMAAGRWAGTYAVTNHEELWAEAVQSWFDDNRENDSLHNHVNTRDELRAYDPALAALVEEVFGDRAWRYVKPARRPAAERAHLAKLDFDALPRFEWRDEPVPAKPLVSIQTALGNIEVELDYEHAPVSVANFLHYVHQGFFSDGHFFRVLTPTNQPDAEFPIEVIQACTNPAWEDRLLPPIAHESTGDSGLRHLDGTLSMARFGPGTAREHFFICVGDQPELDFGGGRQPDGQGFAAFGRVIEGMELVRRIQALPAEGQMLVEPLPIQRAIRQN